MLYNRLFANPKHLFWAYNLVLFITFLLLNSNLPYDGSVWIYFPDCQDYLALSKKTFGYDFIFNTPQGLNYSRGFVTPLFYKIANSDPETIVLYQRIFYSLAVAIFAGGTQKIFKNIWIKYSWILACYVVFAAWASLRWTGVLLSESLGISVFIIWISFFVAYEATRKKKWLLLSLIIIPILFFTRDNFSYLVCLIYVVSLIKNILIKKILKGTAILLVYSLAFFLIHNHSVKVGKRDRLPLINSLLARIAQHPDYLNWYKERGVPMYDSISLNFKGINADDPYQRNKVYKVYENINYKALNDWINKNGRTIYFQFMLSHPSYFFLTREEWNDAMRNNIFPEEIEYYTGPRQGYSKFFPGKLFLFPPLSLLILFIICAQVFFLRKEHWMSFIILIIVLALMFFMTYNSDAFEIGRHMYMNLFIRELLGFLFLFYFLDNYYLNAKLKKIVKIGRDKIAVLVRKNKTESETI